MSKHIDNKYWWVFVPENGEPRVESRDTEHEFLALLEAPLLESGWVFCYFGCELPILPGCTGFVTPTGRTVLGRFAPPEDVTPIKDRSFFTAKPQADIEQRLITL